MVLTTSSSVAQQTQQQLHGTAECLAGDPSRLADHQAVHAAMLSRVSSPVQGFARAVDVALVYPLLLQCGAVQATWFAGLAAEIAQR